MTLHAFPPRGINPDLIRKLGKVQEKIELIDKDEPPPPGINPRLLAMKEKMRRVNASVERGLYEMTAEILEIHQIIDEGYKNGVLPIDQELAASADEFNRNLKAFDQRVAGEEAEWSREDAAETPRRK